MRIVILLVAAALCASPAMAQMAEATVIKEAPIFLQPGAQTPLRVAAVGSSLKVLKVEADWAQVEFNDPQFGRRVGWVAIALIQIARPGPTSIDQSISATPSLMAAPAPANTRESSPAVGQQPSTQTSKLKNVKIRGYVTEVVSPTEFEIEDYRITRDSGFVLDLENVDATLSFNSEDIRIGVELEIKGLFNEATGELKAQSIKVDMEQFKRVKQTAVISKRPAGLEPADGAWQGEFFVDGQRVVVSPVTQVVYKLTGRERKAVKKKAKEHADESEFRSITSLDQIGIGTLMTYDGDRRVADGAIAASRIEVVNNDLEDGEAKLWKSLKVSAKPAQGFNPGELKIDKVGRFKLLPNEEVQQYVSGLGYRLIPSYQRELPDGTPYKIPFRFYVVNNKSANAFALPNGVVVVHSGLIDLLENEAQLAAIISHEVAHSVQEHSWRQMQYHKKKRIGLALVSAVAAAYGQHDLSNLVDMVQGAIQNGHSRSLENQADRIGLEYMIAAGYDPREAPRVWKLMTKKYGLQQTDVFWSSHENQATRRSYLMNELKNNYRRLDYASLRTNEEEFARIQGLARNSTDARPKVKVR